MCSPLPRGAHEAAGTQAGRQTAATPCMGSSGAVGTESGKKLTNHPGGWGGGVHTRTGPLKDKQGLQVGNEQRRGGMLPAEALS